MTQHFLSRRDFLHASLASAAAAFPIGAAGQSASRPPNVLFIVIDDLDCRIGCYGDPVAKTPAIDRLAERGVRFDRAYCQFPLCNPTRSSVFSGRYPTSTGVLDNNTYLVLDDGQYTMQEHFQRNGYGVSEFGKIWHGPNQGMRKSDPMPTPPASQRTGERPDWFTPEERSRQQREKPDYWDHVHTPYRSNPDDPDRYAWANVFGPLAAGDRGQDAQIADQAIASLRQTASETKPFFLAVGFHKPHVPLTAPQEYFDLYDVAEMQLPPDFDEEPRLIAGMPPDEFRMNIDLFRARSFSPLEAREAMRAYYACTSYVDAQVGRLLDELDQLGLAEDTIIALWGDHGWHLSEKGMWAKGTLFEVSARGPLLIADPRKSTGGSACRRVTQYLDMYPTLVELCGLPKASWTEGNSLIPLLENPDAEWGEPAFTVQTRKWFVGRSVRTERWRYTEWDEGRRGSALFDHDRDPHEMTNLAGVPEFAAVVTRMQGILRSSPISKSASDD